MLNGSSVSELELSLCGQVSQQNPIQPGQYLTIVGLKKLQVSITGAKNYKDASVPNFSLNVHNRSSNIAFLDLWSSRNHLKAYSVVAPPLAKLKKHFPELATHLKIQSSDLEEMYKPLLLTIVY